MCDVMRPNRWSVPPAGRLQRLLAPSPVSTPDTQCQSPSRVESTTPPATNTNPQSQITC
ncbi:hypothetical protein B0T16DRAFT_404032 [Cercophora newfieldiana]|uniref:Uncharacterized protein n=1 Tax=Cercophora newfieldiana TaxID=92897 RepID=A0AA40CUU5_9PEZI|nr:hypothetical protein B0T16DRAFT_404032 [Cercophora newfieldiana]